MRFPRCRSLDIAPGHTYNLTLELGAALEANGGERAAQALLRLQDQVPRTPGVTHYKNGKREGLCARRIVL